MAIDEAEDDALLFDHYYKDARRDFYDILETELVINTVA